MLANFLINSIKRHLKETRPLVEQLSNEVLSKKVTTETRDIAELILHMIRSIEYYLQGIVLNIWKPLPYSVESYNSAEKIIELFDLISLKANSYLDQISDELLAGVVVFNRQASKAEILAELLEHSLHHRGQLTVYYRLNNIVPAEIDYII